MAQTQQEKNQTNAKPSIHSQALIIAALPSLMSLLTIRVAVRTAILSRKTLGVVAHTRYISPKLFGVPNNVLFANTVEMKLNPII